MAAEKHDQTGRAQVSLGNGTLVFEVPVSSAEAAHRLRAAIDAPDALYRTVPGVTRGKRFVGTVGSDRFEIAVRRSNYNSFAPRAYGEILPTDRGCRITARIRIWPVARIGAAGLAIGAAVSGAPILLSIGYPLPFVVIFVAAVTGLAAWAYSAAGRAIGIPRSEAEELQGLLRATFAP